MKITFNRVFYSAWYAIYLSQCLIAGLISFFYVSIFFYIIIYILITFYENYNPKKR
jgi:hypothetical protein